MLLSLRQDRAERAARSSPTCPRIRTSAQELRPLFPGAARRDATASLLREHRLRREIIATATTNSIVNRMGPTFVARTQQDTGADAGDRRARLRDRARGRSTCASTWRGDRSARQQGRGGRAVRDGARHASALLRQATYWLIQRHRTALGIEQQVARLRPGHPRAVARAAAAGCRAPIARPSRPARPNCAKAGVPAELARRVAACSALHCAPDIVELAAGAQADGRGRRARLLRHRRALRARLAARAHRGTRHRGPLACGRARQPARGTVRSASQPRAGVCSSESRETRPGQGRGQQWLGVAQGRGRARARASSTTCARSTTAIDFASLSVALQAVRRLASPEG